MNDITRTLQPEQRLHLGRVPSPPDVDLQGFVNRVLYHATQFAPCELHLEDPVDETTVHNWKLYSMQTKGCMGITIATVDNSYLRMVLAYLIHSVIGGETYVARKWFDLTIKGQADYRCYGMVQNTLGAYWAKLLILEESQQEFAP
jgi:hypothetical protein